ncbi:MULTISPECIES: DUF5676 family membrane protein [Psychrobacter]|jgi:hypothetical protein|uniref:DUF5676 family membrane protein n=1 Tax=Psychrobacter TaxID=497 RepID=UPI000432C057|nr:MULTISPECIES: DUF5676 family membrane protein [unclassified Psychrobacter]KRG36089.1 hypothetical protein AK824_02620 [Psychrobacter sp. P11G3]MCG3843610.1 hypothetical protein [Psychrobacter sp. Ps1]MDN3442117.1 DUF5676 family membrane protein [Psychrobacter sp. APC 3279]GAF54399.1 hypothetical protein JCM18900_13032 [Psychrobacter sp. JCM 18900]
MNELNSKANTLRIGPVGNSVSLFLLISYLLCIGFGLLAPEQISMHEAWAPLLPGFEWLTWSGFLIGFVESYLYGWYFAIVFVPLYRWFAKAG